MIKKIIYLIILSLVVAFFVSWLVDQEGNTVIYWQNWEIEISTNVFIGLLIFSAILIIFLDRTIRMILNWPAWLSHNWKLRRKISGERALSLGMIALAASDFPEAKKQAKKAEKLIGSGVLPDLLSAQASHGSGDRKAALRYFTNLSSNKDTSYFGYIGLMKLFQLQGKYNASVKSAKSALKIKPKSSQASAMLLDYELSRKNWIGCLEHLNILCKYNSNDRTGPKNPKLLASHICLQISKSKKETNKEIEWLRKAIEWCPNFIEANIRLSKAEFQRRNFKKSISYLETAIKILPHSDLADELVKITDDNDGQFVARLSNLAKYSNFKDEGLLLVSEVALNKGIWASASSFLEQVSDSGKTNKYYILQARLAEERNLPEAREQAMRKAAIAPRGGGWKCENCGSNLIKWMMECPSCKTMGQVNWNTREEKNEIFLKK